MNSPPLIAITRPVKQGISLTVKARPGQNRPRPAKMIALGDGLYAVEITIAAPAEDGKANAALIKAIASQMHIPQQDITITNGTRGRIKHVMIQGDPEILLQRLQLWLA